MPCDDRLEGRAGWLQAPIRDTRALEHLQRSRHQRHAEPGSGCLLGVRDGGAGFVEEHSAGSRQFDVTRRPVEEGRLQLVLETADLLAQRRLGYVGPLNRAGEIYGLPTSRIAWSRHRPLGRRTWLSLQRRRRRGREIRGHPTEAAPPGLSEQPTRPP